MRPERSAAKWCAIVAGALTVVVTAAGAAATPGYSHMAHYISELGARGTTVGAVVSYLGFLAIGLAALAAIVLGLRDRVIDAAYRSSALWLLTLPIAYITAAFARCTAGCAGVDAAQALHNLAGLGEYLGGAIALFVAAVVSFRMRRIVPGAALTVLGVAVLYCLGAMTAPAWLGRHGAAQRIAEIVLFGFLLFLVWRPADHVSRGESRKN